MDLQLIKKNLLITLGSFSDKADFMFIFIEAGFEAWASLT